MIMLWILIGLFFWELFLIVFDKEVVWLFLIVNKGWIICVRGCSWGSIVFKIVVVNNVVRMVIVKNNNLWNFWGWNI